MRATTLRALPKRSGMKFYTKRAISVAGDMKPWSAVMDTAVSNPMAAKLDPREEHHRIASPHSGLSLFLRYLSPRDAKSERVVLYVHGGTFPSALSIAHRFDGRSWRDELNNAAFHVWGLDF